MLYYRLAVIFMLISMAVMPDALAQIVRLEVGSTEPAFEGKVFGETGP
jgi:hypothetical protein